MAMKQYHVIDPTFFYDALLLFNMSVDWYCESDKKLDRYGELSTTYEHRIIEGSLQSQGTSLNMSKDGNSEDMKYEFYCKSLYRIKIGDFLFYKNRWLHVESVRDFDEWGVRSAVLKMVNITNYKDLQETIKYLNGEISI